MLDGHVDLRLDSAILCLVEHALSMQTKPSCLGVRGQVLYSTLCFSLIVIARPGSEVTEGSCWSSLVFRVQASHVHCVCWPRRQNPKMPEPQLLGLQVMPMKRLLF